MKIVKVLLVGMFVLGVCKPAGAMDFDVKNIKYIGSLDMFSVANAADRSERRIKAWKTAGWVSSYKLDTNAALGFRIGALYPIEDVADVGLSWGYVSGPNGELKMTTPDRIEKQDINRRFYRFLAEGRRTFKIDDKFSFLGGAGLGLAYGREEHENTTAGAELRRNDAGALVPTKSDKYFSGLAWELTAGAVYKATDKLNVEAGVKYAGFPSNPADPPTLERGSENFEDGDFPGMNWTTLGFFVGVSF